MGILMIDKAFHVDDQRDRELASDRYSRYGAYLTQKRPLFHYDGSEQPPTTCAVRFAIAAWTVATPPVMAPGYVLAHPRIQGTDFHWDDSRAALAVHIAAPAPPITNRLTSSWCSWHRDAWSRQWQDPYLNDSVTVLSTLTIRLPLPVTRFPAPQYTSAGPNTDVAKASVAALCHLVNSEFEDLLSAIDQPSAHHHARRS
jgi:hypothetical protein